MHYLLLDPFAAAYMRRALAELALLGVFGGIVGVHVLLRRLAFQTEVVQHTVFPGIAIAFALGQPLLLGALATGVLAVVMLTIGQRRPRVDPDALMALLIATFFAAGVVVVSRRRGFQSDLTSLLFGRILAVDRQELVSTAIVAVIGLTALLLVHKELVLLAFDPAGSAALGYRVARLELLLNLVVMLVVVVAVRALGTVLVVAFVVTPAAAARLLTRRILPMMVTAVAVAVLSGWLGLVVSYQGSVRHGWRLASGATVVVVLTVVFLGAAGARQALAAHRHRRLAGAAPDQVTGPAAVAS